MPTTKTDLHTAMLTGIFALRDGVRAIMRDGVETDTSIVAADLIREVVEWAEDKPDDYQRVADFANQPRFHNRRAKI